MRNINKQKIYNPSNNHHVGVFLAKFNFIAQIKSQKSRPSGEGITKTWDNGGTSNLV